MGLADYYRRGAVAAAQLIAGFDEAAFRAKLEAQHVHIQIGADAARSSGPHLADLLVRILARLYPAVSITGHGKAAALADDMAALAPAINPKIELDPRGDITAVVAVGSVPRGRIPSDIVFAGSRDWDALVDASVPQPIHGRANPFGAGAAACLAAANVFRTVFLDGELRDHDLVFSALLREVGPTPTLSPRRLALPSDSVLVGAGAIGNAAAWALSRAGLTGTMHVVDPEPIELSNLQRYVVTERTDEGRVKVEVLRDRLGGAPEQIGHAMDWASFVASHGYEWGHVLVALDSAADRRAVQASLPRWIGNAWTQPEDLGVSVHCFDRGGCLSCLYLPDGPSPNEDEIIAAALGVPERLLEVRGMLAYGTPVTEDFVGAVAAALQVPPGPVLAFAGSNIRRLYVEGLCGGAIAPMANLFGPRSEMHVPVAHQSALAGVLLAASLVAELQGVEQTRSQVSRLDLRKPVGQFITQPLAADPRDICICRDATYLDAYREKYGGEAQ